MTVTNSESVKPNLFLVGFQKCGSSSLFDFLNSHPNIEGSNPKETFMLCDKDNKLFQNRIYKDGPDQWLNYYRNFTNDSIYFLEGSVCNVNQKEAMNYIGSLNEKKVVFIMRDPIERFVSTFTYRYNELIKHFGDLDINDYFQIVSQNKVGFDDICKNAIDSGRYAEHISNWKRRIGEDDVLLIGIKELLDLNKLSLKVSSFLDLQNLFDSRPHLANTSSYIKNIRLQIIANKLNSVLPKGKIKRKIGRLFNKFNSDSLIKPEFNKKLNISEENHKKLKAIYSVEYKTLNNYF